MKNVVVGAAFALGLIGTIAWANTRDGRGVGRSEALSPVATSQRLITFATPVGADRQQITVIDSESRVVCVYHCELRTGQIELKSVRNIAWDLQMDEFNCEGPTPKDIRELIDRRR